MASLMGIADEIFILMAAGDNNRAETVLSGITMLRQRSQLPPRFFASHSHLQLIYHTP